MAPGVRVTVDNTEWAVHSFDAHADEYIIEQVQQPYSSTNDRCIATNVSNRQRRVPPSFFDTKSSSSAPLYPLVWVILERATEAALATQNVMRDPKGAERHVRELLEHCQEHWEEQLQQEELRAEIQPLPPRTTSVLEEAGIRLDWSNGEQSQQQQNAIQTTKTALQAVRTLLQYEDILSSVATNTDETSSGENEITNVWSSIRSAAATDPAVAHWVEAADQARGWLDQVAGEHLRLESGDASILDRLLHHLVPESVRNTMQTSTALASLLTCSGREAVVWHMEETLFRARQQWEWPPPEQLAEWAETIRNSNVVGMGTQQGSSNSDSHSSTAMMEQLDQWMSLLNSDAVVTARETIAASGALEALPEAQQQMMDLARQATANVDWNKLMQDVTDDDDSRRDELLAQATDAALDFCLRILPSMPVPPLEGVRDGLIYQLGNLSLEGLRVRKESIHMEWAGIGKNIKKKTSSGPHELLVIHIHDISAVLKDVVWSFEQTYLPYLKGSGTASAELSGGSIRLNFQLRKRRVPAEDDKSSRKWEPILCLHDRHCAIDEVMLNLDGTGRITWMVNKLASVFKGPLRDYVVATIVDLLSRRSGWILQRLNEILAPYGDLLLRTAQLTLVRLLLLVLLLICLISHYLSLGNTGRTCRS